MLGRSSKGLSMRRMGNGRKRSVWLVAIAVAAIAMPAFAARGVTLLVSRATAGEPADSTSFYPSITPDGRQVSFISFANNLGAPVVPTDSALRLFVRTIADEFGSGQTAYLNIDAAFPGIVLDWSASSISGTGRYVAFVARRSGQVTDEVFVHDRDSDNDMVFDEPGAIATRRLTIPVVAPFPNPNGDSYEPEISRDGRWVAFASRATNLVAGDANWAADVFAADVQTGVIKLISRSTIGQAANENSGEPSISADGRFVAFTSEATNLANIPGGDNNLASDIFMRDRDLDNDHIYDEQVAGAIETLIVSVGPGRHVGNGASSRPAIRADGAQVVFASLSDNLQTAQSLPTGPPIDTNGTSDVYLRDRLQQITNLVTKNLAGIAATGASIDPVLSDDGESVAFVSKAGDMTPRADGSTPYPFDQIFVRDLTIGHVELISINSVGEAANADANSVAMAQQAQNYVAFASWANNLEPGAASSAVYRHQRNLCSAGDREDGFVSNLIHDTLEPIYPPVGPALHEANCNYVVPNGL